MLPIVYSSSEQMASLSNKRDDLQNIFEHLNHRKLGRIDALELYSSCLLACDGRFEDFLNNMILIFGFTDQDHNLSITSEEFHLFLDSLLRGVMKFVTPPQLILNPVQQRDYRRKQETPHLGKKVSHATIQPVVRELYENVAAQGFHDCSSMMKCFTTA